MCSGVKASRAKFLQLYCSRASSRCNLGPSPETKAIRSCQARRSLNSTMCGSAWFESDKTPSMQAVHCENFCLHCVWPSLTAYSEQVSELVCGIVGLYLADRPTWTVHRPCLPCLEPLQRKYTCSAEPRRKVGSDCDDTIGGRRKTTTDSSGSRTVDSSSSSWQRRTTTN